LSRGRTPPVAAAPCSSPMPSLPSFLGFRAQLPFVAGAARANQAGSRTREPAAAFGEDRQASPPRLGNGLPPPRDPGRILRMDATGRQMQTWEKIKVETACHHLDAPSRAWSNCPVTVRFPESHQERPVTPSRTLAALAAFVLLLTPLARADG